MTAPRTLVGENAIITALRAEITSLTVELHQAQETLTDEEMRGNAERQALRAEIARLTAERDAALKKTAVWPDFVAPPKFESPCEGWEDPRLPDFRLIWKVARECGYSIGLHGSMRRDCDMIAAPWTDDAVLAFELIERLCTALNARVVGPVAGKPHGRLGWNLQVDGWVKVIDISVMPRACDATREPITVQDAARALAEAINNDMMTFNKALGTLTAREDMPTQHFFAEAILAYADALRAIAEQEGR